MPSPAFCTQCGASLNENARFCPKCGHATAADNPPSDETSPQSMRWQIEVPLLTNRFVMTDVIVGCAATVFLCWLILFLAFAWGSDFRDLGKVWRVSATFALGGAIFLSTISLFVLLVFFGNRHPLEFILDDDGVVMNNISERAKVAHRLAWLVALATGRPLMAGPGLIAQSREVVAIPWDEVRRVKTYPALGVIAIRGGLLENIRLYCTHENYPAVLERVSAALAAHNPSIAISQA